jgi:hypothetical protein
VAAIVKRTDDPQDLGIEELIRCPLCSQVFALTTSNSEWNKLIEWRRLGAMALRENHKLRHEELPLHLAWKMKHKR